MRKKSINLVNAKNFTVRLPQEDTELLNALSERWQRSRGECLRLAFRMGVASALKVANAERETFKKLLDEIRT